MITNEETLSGFNTAINNDIDIIEKILADFKEAEKNESILSKYSGKVVNLFKNIDMCNSILQLGFVFSKKTFNVSDNPTKKEILNRATDISVIKDKLEYMAKIFSAYTNKENSLISNIRAERNLKKNIKKLYDETVVFLLSMDNKEMSYKVYEEKVYDIINGVLDNYKLEDNFKEFILPIFKRIISENFMDKDYEISAYIKSINDISLSAPKNTLSAVKYLKDFDTLEDFEEYFDKQDDIVKMNIITNLIDNNTDEDFDPNDKVIQFMRKNSKFLRKIESFK